MEATSIWIWLQEATSEPEEPGQGLRAWLRDKVDLALYRPEAAPGVVVSRLTGRTGEYYVLKNPATKTYYRLSARDFYLWQRMDGSRTVKDLVVAYFLEYGSFAFARTATLVQGLKASFLLNERPLNVYQQVRGRLEKRRPGHRLAQFWSAFLQKPFALSGLDRFVGGLYRWGGWLLFTWPLQVLFLAVSLLGLYAFVQALGAGVYGVVTIAGSAKLGIAGLIVANLAAIFLHEMAHALTVKHYGREVRRGGFMIYFAMPAFFVDTTDIWLEGKRARLAVTWAGPYSGLILGGAASMLIIFWPENALNPLLFQFAFLSYLSVFLNLNPLLELDGYYLLMDWLEIPMLRRKSLEFLRSGLWTKIKGIRDTGSGLKGTLDSFSREEKIFSVFGLLSAVWTVYAIFMGAYFWQERLAGALRDLWTQGGDLGKIAMSVVMVVLGLFFILSISLAVFGMARKAVRWADRRGLFARSWNVAGMLLVATVALAYAPGYLGYPALGPLIGLAALVLATAFAWHSALDYAGSRLSRTFWLLGTFSLLLAFSEAASLALSLGLLTSEILGPLTLGLGYLAYLVLLLAGISLFGSTNLRDLRLLEKGLLAVGLAACYGLVLWLVIWPQSSLRAPAEALLGINASLIPVLVLTLLVPTLASFWPTAFGPAWLMVGLALGGLALTTLLGQPPFLPYLLLSSGLFLQYPAYRQVTLLRDQPEAELALSDGRRLQRAFGWTVAAIVAQFRQVAGDRSAHALAEQFNSYSLAAGWRLSLVRGRMEDAAEAGLSLIERGELSAAALSLLLDLVAQEVGQKLTKRALQQAYDGLPWEEREIGAQYLFREMHWAKALSQEFQSTRQDYRGLLLRIPLFATMDAAEIDLLCSCLRAERYAPRQTIIHQGERGDRFYIVRCGNVEVTVRGERGVSEVVNKLDRGDYFGELALLQEAPRNATCRATVPTELLSLSRQDFDRLVRSRFALREKMDLSLARADLLRRIPLFAEMDAQQLQRVAAQLREQRYEPGATVVQQGQIGETFYVIETGRVQVSLAQNGVDQMVTERGPGEYVGEIALLLEIPRTATVRAVTPARLLALHQDDFDRLVADHLCVSRGLERDTSRRMIDLRRVA